MVAVFCAAENPSRFADPAIIFLENREIPPANLVKSNPTALKGNIIKDLPKSSTAPTTGPPKPSAKLSINSIDLAIA